MNRRTLTEIEKLNTFVSQKDGNDSSLDSDMDEVIKVEDISENEIDLKV